MPTTITILAEKAGVSRPTVYEWIKKGYIKRTPSGKLDIDDVDVWVLKNTVKIVSPERVEAGKDEIKQ